MELINIHSNHSALQKRVRNKKKSYFLTKTYVVGNEKNRLIETVL